MAKLTKDELIQKISEKIEDNELQIELMEDIADSFDGGEVALAELQAKFDELQNKYKERFLKVEEVAEEVVEEASEEETEEIKEEEVIDVEEI